MKPASRRCDIDMGGAIWLYRPSQHKTAWRGKPRVISVGPKAQVLLRVYFTPHLDEYLFSPRQAVEELHASRTANRKTPKYPSHMKRNLTKRTSAPSRAPAQKYTVTAYEHAIARACEKAFPAPASICQQRRETKLAWRERLNPVERKELAAWQAAHRWAPNQLRPSFATQVRKAPGLEARCSGTREPTSPRFAERNLTLAARVASEIGTVPDRHREIATEVGRPVGRFG